jgi:hypothetical protein
VKRWPILFIIVLFAALATDSFGQNSAFQKGRKAVQRHRFKHTTARVGKACEIFEKKRVKGAKKPIISLGLGRKRKPKMAEQN